MRHNQNGRRFRGNGGRSNHHNGGGNNGNTGGGGHSNNGQRRVNPRVQTFDSNGPDVRIRGNAIQINEKYLTLAKDAMSAGDRVLAESYLQHAEHYQRMLNEAAEEYNRHQAQFQQQQPQQQHAGGEEAFVQDGNQQPDVAMDDLDQSFLRTPVVVDGEQPQQQQGGRQQHQRRDRRDNRGQQPATEQPKEAETA